MTTLVSLIGYINTVTALTSNTIEVSVEDTAAMIFRFANGAGTFPALRHCGRHAVGQTSRKHQLPSYDDEDVSHRRNAGFAAPTAPEDFESERPRWPQVRPRPGRAWIAAILWQAK
jgi:hypothetical protein